MYGVTTQTCITAPPSGEKVGSGSFHLQPFTAVHAAVTAAIYVAGSSPLLLGLGSLTEVAYFYTQRANPLVQPAPDILGRSARPLLSLTCTLQLYDHLQLSDRLHDEVFHSVRLCEVFRFVRLFEVFHFHYLKLHFPTPPSAGRS